MSNVKFARYYDKRYSMLIVLRLLALTSFTASLTLLVNENFQLSCIMDIFDKFIVMASVCTEVNDDCCCRS